MSSVDLKCDDLSYMRCHAMTCVTYPKPSTEEPELPSLQALQVCLVPHLVEAAEHELHHDEGGRALRRRSVGHSVGLTGLAMFSQPLPACWEGAN